VVSIRRWVLNCWPWRLKPAGWICSVPVSLRLSELLGCLLRYHGSGWYCLVLKLPVAGFVEVQWSCVVVELEGTRDRL
jgi:hypothetical protein